MASPGGRRPASDPRGAGASPHTVQLYVELANVAPIVWRRLLVPADIKLASLHRVLQIAMGWTDSHLHRFDLAGKAYGMPDDEWPEADLADDRRVTLEQALARGVDQFRYEYDFGDGWEHLIRIEPAGAAAEGRATCLAGENACPPEDVGGPPGYLEFLTAISDPRHEDHAAMLEWCGGAFDPRRFDLDAVNASLQRLKLPPAR